MSHIVTIRTEVRDAAAVPLDTTIIRRVSIAPPASRLLTIRDAIKPGCR